MMALKNWRPPKVISISPAVFFLGFWLVWSSCADIENTIPTDEILSGKNVRAFLVCGFLMKSFKKNILKI